MPKATQQEHAERVQLVRNWISCGMTTSQLKMAMRDHVGFRMSARQITRYIRLARDLGRKETGIPREDHVADSYHVYRSLLDAENPIVRMKAQQAIDKLLGLQAPTRILTGELSEDDLAEEERRLGIAHHRLNGRSHSPAADRGTPSEN